MCVFLFIVDCDEYNKNRHEWGSFGREENVFQEDDIFDVIYKHECCKRWLEMSLFQIVFVDLLKEKMMSHSIHFNGDKKLNVNLV